MSGKLWGGRFVEEIDTTFQDLNSCINIDTKMFYEDIQASIAYAKALQGAELLSEKEEQDITKALQEICKEWEQNRFVLKDSDEDIHTANERRLKELIGDTASKLHTGRSRNDQVATDIKLWLRSGIQKLKKQILDFIQGTKIRAKDEISVIMPGYTHLQRAQPIRLSHWLLSHTWNFKADYERLDELYKRVNIMPLGSGALAGNPFTIDRNVLARNLEFEGITPNSLQAVGDRDYIAEFLFWASLTAVHLSRLAEDLILYSSQEFYFITLHESYCSGSSLMPQKKNPDSLELIRGKAGYIFGQCCGFMMVLKGLPSSYSKDLQEGKEMIFNVYEHIERMLKVASGVIKTMKVNEKACRRVLSPDMLATDVAHYLVRKGVPFREAHHITGQIITEAEKNGKSIQEMELSELQCFSDKFCDDIREVWDYESSVEQYQAEGGTSFNGVLQQLQHIGFWLEEVKSKA